MQVGPPPHMAFHRAGRNEVSGVDWNLVRRVLQFTRAYRARVLWFLAVITAGALVGLVPPLLFRSIFDDAIPTSDRGLVTVLALAAAGVALLAVGLDLVQRWLSAA